MRTKTLLLAAAVTAAGIAATQAQSNVYSLNVVGYYNIVLPAAPAGAGQYRPVSLGLKVNNIDNPTLGNSLTNISGGSLAFAHVYGLGGFGAPLEWSPGDGWEDPAASIAYGRAVFFRNPGATALTITVVGEVMQGALNTTVPNGYSLLAPKVPQSGGLSAVHNFIPPAGDGVHAWNSGWSGRNESDGAGGWELGEPVIPIGGGFISHRLTAGNGTWTRTFNVQ